MAEDYGKTDAIFFTEIKMKDYEVTTGKTKGI
jgi:hypothetical protein